MPDIFWEVWMPNFGSEKITFFRFFMIRSSNLEISKSSGQYTYEISKFPARFQKYLETALPKKNEAPYKKLILDAVRVCRGWY